MKKILVPIVILFILVCALSPILCFRKSVMHSPADMIINAEVVDAYGVKYMLMYDAVFQATSKSSDGGSTEINGSYDARMSVYTLDAGMLVGRKSIGKYYNSKQSVYLGYADGYAWFYSCQGRKKLYAVDILNTAEILSFDQIVSKNPSFAQKFAEPEWSVASQYFGFDKINKRVLLTDMAGVQYGLDTKTLMIHRLDKEYHIGPVSNDPLCTSSKSRFGYISTYGGVRQTIIFNQRQTTSSLSFLECNFIRNVNPNKTVNDMIVLRKSCMDSVKAWEEYRDSIANTKRTSETNDNDQNHFYKEFSNRQIEMLTDKITRLTADITDIETGKDYRTDELLSPDSTSFFVIHKTSISKKALLAIARVSIDGSLNFKQEWSTEIPSIYFDPEEANQKSGFAEVFSSGNPEYDFKQFESADNKLIVIYMLHLFALDITTGRLEWMQQL